MEQLALFEHADSGFVHTPVGLQIDDEIGAALGPIFDKWTAVGYSPRELCYIAFQAANDISLQQIIGWRMP